MTSQFNGKGKKLAWKTWKSLPTVTEGFTTASSSAFVPQHTSSPAFNVIEQCTCAMYDSTTQHSKVNDLRLELFPNTVKLMERLPPTQSALLPMYVPGQYLDTESETGHCCPEPRGFRLVQVRHWMASSLYHGSSCCRGLQKTNTVRLQGCSRVLEKLQVRKNRSGVYRTVSMPW